MQNPFQQTAGGNLNDPLAFVKKLWGDMQLPGMVTPTLSVDELDKQIKDLKTVESWLNVNMNMLKGTIQALEVQRATISALKTMGESFAQAGNAAPSASSAPGTNSTNSNHTSWPMHGNSHSAAPNAVPEPSVEENEEDEMPEDELEEDTDQKQEQAKSANAKQQEQTQFHNPAAWWTVLQDQFKQALSHAMKDEETAVSVDQPKQARAKRTAKVAAGKSGTGSKPRATAAKTATAKAKASAATSAASKRKTVANKAAKTSPKNTVKTRST